MEDNEVKYNKVEKSEVEHNEVEDNEVEHSEVENNKVEKSEVEHNKVEDNKVEHNEVENNKVEDKITLHYCNAHPLPVSHWNIFQLPSEKLTPGGIMGYYLRALLKRLGTIFHGCSKCFRGSLNYVSMMLRGASFSDGCTPGRCEISKRIPVKLNPNAIAVTIEWVI